MKGWLVWQHLPAGLATPAGWLGNRIRSIVAEAYSQKELWLAEPAVVPFVGRRAAGVE